MPLGLEVHDLSKLEKKNFSSKVVQSLDQVRTHLIHALRVDAIDPPLIQEN
jgi:hypothetical protein